MQREGGHRKKSEAENTDKNPSKGSPCAQITPGPAGVAHS